MRVCWGALIGYGFVFWIVLCITDLLGVTNVQKYSQDFDELYENSQVKEHIGEQLEPRLTRLEHKGLKFGRSLVLWNVLTFFGSIIVCSFGRNIAWICWNIYKTYKNKWLISRLNRTNMYTRSVGSLSKIPVMVKPIARLSDINITSFEAKYKLDTEKSCPNLLIRRSGSNVSNVTDISTRTCRTLFRKEIYVSEDPCLSSEQQLEKQCKKLREELHRLQTTSLKEHAILSRKLDSVNKEKMDLCKVLNVVQKENRAAKQQLEELLQEKAALLKKLDNATKEFKNNTKTKKFALAKLEEVTNNVEELSQQLEQVSRDKEILEKKLKLLETEYTKLHERYIASQQKFYVNRNDENTPERDRDYESNKASLENVDFSELDDNIAPSVQQTADVLASVSQTELDMKKIQEKIKQLEKNLENLNMNTGDCGYDRSFAQPESEISLSGINNSTDSQQRNEDDNGTLSGFSSSTTPRQKYWTDRVLDTIGRTKYQFSKLQALNSKMQEKSSFLGDIREKTENAGDVATTDSEDAEPKRLVSSSVAFKNFLKSLNRLDASKRHLPGNSEVYF